MERERKSSLQSVFAVFAMIVLFVLIFIPPLFRIIFKEEKEIPLKEEVEKTKPKATALSCKRQEMVGTMQYTISVTTSYQDDIFHKIVFQYARKGEVDPTILENKVEKEMLLLRQSPAVVETMTDTSNKFEMTRESIEQNNADEVAKLYYQPLEMQKANLENLNYVCQEMTT